MSMNTDLSLIFLCVYTIFRNVGVDRIAQETFMIMFIIKNIYIQSIK